MSENPMCEVPGCGRLVHTTGLCVACYSRYRRRTMVHPRTGRMMQSMPRKQKDPSLGPMGVPDGKRPGKCKACGMKRRINPYDRCGTCWSIESSRCVDATDISWLSLDGIDDYDGYGEEMML